MKRSGKQSFVHEFSTIFCDNNNALKCLELNTYLDLVDQGQLEVGVMETKINQKNVADNV